MRRNVVLLFCMVLGIAGCSSSTSNPPAANQSQTADAATTPLAPSAIPSTQAIVPAAPAVVSTAKPNVDACALLSGKEIEDVQGEPVKETKLSGQSSGGLNLSQCFFTLPTFTNSISLLVAQRGEGSEARDPKDFWSENFHEKSGSKAKDREKREGKEEGEESAPPQRISGLGQEAFWTGNRIAGALYILKGNAYVRISVGGSNSDTSKRRLRALAQKAIARL